MGGSVCGSDGHRRSGVTSRFVSNVLRSCYCYLGEWGIVATQSDDQSRCSHCGAVFAPGTGLCPQCGHDSVFDPPRFPELRQVSAIERVMLTMLYIEDRDSKWWDRPGRALFLSVVAVIGYLLWLSLSVP